MYLEILYLLWLLFLCFIEKYIIIIFLSFFSYFLFLNIIVRINKWWQWLINYEFRIKVKVENIKLKL